MLNPVPDAAGAGNGGKPKDVLSNMAQGSFILRMVYIRPKGFAACEEYEDFPQLENGVGMMALLSMNSLSIKECPKMHRHAGKPMGEECKHRLGNAFRHIKQLAGIGKRYNNLQMFIPLKYIWENVTVTGLLTGGDIYGSLKTRGPNCFIKGMLKSGEELLDDIDVNEPSNRLKTKLDSGK